MKRNQDRILPQRSASAAARQGKTAAAALSASPASPPPVPAQQPDRIRFELSGPGADKSGVCIELTAEELSHIRAGWLKKSPPLEWRLDEWAKSALLHQANRDMIPHYPLHALEDAVNTVIGLLAVMADSNSKLRTELRDGPRIGSAAHADCGIQNLVRSAGDQLLDTFKASFDYATGRKEVKA